MNTVGLLIYRKSFKVNHWIYSSIYRSDNCLSIDDNRFLKLFVYRKEQDFQSKSQKTSVYLKSIYLFYLSLNLFIFLFFSRFIYLSIYLVFFHLLMYSFLFFFVSRTSEREISEWLSEAAIPMEVEITSDRQGRPSGTQISSYLTISIYLSVSL